MRHISILDMSRSGQKHRDIPFDLIAEVAIDQLETDSDSRFDRYGFGYPSIY
ncbi:MAG: hypothetical protein WAW36_00850 [Methylovulum miyakonense]|uniref:hypothetical protein n=1 Tax=Methylovulum miyakonense TaxID=645578 RepID=UPI003BB62BCF